MLVMVLLNRIVFLKHEAQICFLGQPHATHKMKDFLETRLGNVKGMVMNIEIMTTWLHKPPQIFQTCALNRQQPACIISIKRCKCIEWQMVSQSCCKSSPFFSKSATCLLNISRNNGKCQRWCCETALFFENMKLKCVSFANPMQQTKCKIFWKQGWEMLREW